MRIEELLVKPLSPFPNNPDIPLIIYHNVIDRSKANPQFFEQLFKKNGWVNSWRNGVYPIHHFHSTAHEVLGCYSGKAEIIFGGPHGIKVGLNCGDAVMVPAGVSHKLLESDNDFHVVGAYPIGTNPDICKGNERDYEVLLKRIKKIPLTSYPVQ